MDADRKTLCLCAGMQSSGSSLVSWCFLQRSDMDGVLDGDNSILPTISPDLGRPLVWYKTTISCFRLTELAQHFEDVGWRVKPLLIVRDVRHVWASLLKKPYGQSGITAEQPPVKTKLRRFKADWELFQQNGWPMLRYESLLERPEASLRAACDQLNLAWDDAMVSWPKLPHEILDTRQGNHTFWSTRETNLVDSIAQSRKTREPLWISMDDLKWLETEFHAFNLRNNYPVRLEPPDVTPCDETLALPDYRQTLRYKFEIRRRPIRWILAALGIRDRTLEQKYLKKAG
jgi:hypothetical protein